MKLYCFHNWYLGGNQPGIQSLHSAARLFVKYQPTLEEDPMVEMLYDWATNHETAVILNGGDRHNLNRIYELISGINKYPFAAFVEDGVCDSISNISLVLPTELCEEVQKYRDDECSLFNLELDTDVIELVKLIAKSRLM